jgi:Polysaccharide biosynthesis protein
VPVAGGDAVTAGSQSRIAVRGSLVTVTGQAGRFAIQTVSVLVLARLLRPEDFGLMAMVLSVAGVAGVIGDAGLSLAALASADLDDDQRSALFWLNGAVGLATAGALALMAPWLALFFRRPELAVLMYALAPSFALMGLSVQFRAHINRELRFAALVVVDVGSQALALAFAVVLAMSGAGVWSIVGQYLAAAGSTFVGSACSQVAATVAADLDDDVAVAALRGAQPGGAVAELPQHQRAGHDARPRRRGHSARVLQPRIHPLRPADEPAGGPADPGGPADDREAAR